MSVTSREWLRLIEEEYLSSFIPAGGAAVKFVVAPDAAMVETLVREFDALAARHELVRVHLDSAETRLHMIQDVFFAISRQIDWRGLAQSFVERLFAERRYLWPLPGQAVTITDLAAANNTDETFLRRYIPEWLTESVMGDTRMAQDFRIAMTQLCQERVAPNDADERGTPVLEWLRGELRTIGPLKRTFIYNKITRHNARPMLRSIGRWMRLLGYRGLLVTLDIRRLCNASPFGSPGVRYTTSAVMDAYEVLRQLIDEADHFEGFFLAVLSDPKFNNGDEKRSVSAYRALHMRICDDVKAAARDNPLVPLVTLAPGGAQ